MERLSRLAYRIVWVNPRVSAAGFVPRAGGMVAALPYVDALVSGHCSTRWTRSPTRSPGATASIEVPEAEEETWESATPVAGQLGGDAVREDEREALHLPGLRAARRAAAPGRRPASRRSATAKSTTR